MQKNERKKTSARKRNVRAAQRRAQAMQLRLEGHSIRTIAAKLGMAPAAVHDTIVTGLRETVQPVADELREMELQRLDILWASLQRGIKAGESDAVRAAVRVMEQRARLLGLYSAERVEHSGPGGTPLSLVVDTGLVASSQPAKSTDAGEVPPSPNPGG